MKITSFILYIGLLALLCPNIISVMHKSEMLMQTKTNMHFGLFKARSRVLKKQIEPPQEVDKAFKNFTKDDLPDVPIYYEGWIKYFHYIKNDDDRPRSFYKNDHFHTQWKSNTTKPDDEVYFLFKYIILYF